MSDPARGRIVLGLALAVSLALFLRALDVAGDHFAAPFDLVWETPGLATVKLIRSGQNPYDPAVHAHPPFILTLYTPLYYYLVALLPERPGNPFFFGRLVSATAMVGAAGLLFFVGGRRDRLALPVLAFATFFSLWPVTSNTVFMKCDPLALLFAASAVVLLDARRDRAWSPVACAALCVLAIATKQSYVAAGIGCALHLLVTSRPQCLRFVLSGLAFGGAFVLLASLQWGAGFWFSTVSALGQEIRGEQVRSVLTAVFRQPLAWFVVALCGLTAVGTIRRSGLRVFRDSPYAWYAISTAVVIALAVGKIGSSTNYFFEVFLSQLMWIVYSLRDTPAARLPRRLRALVATLFIAGCGSEFWIPGRSDYSFTDPELTRDAIAHFSQLKRNVDAFGFHDPAVLNLATHQDTYSVTDRDYVNDPLLYALLWNDHILDPAVMVDSLADQVYDIVILPEGTTLDSPILLPRRILQAIFTSYRPVAQGSGNTYYVRRAPSPG